MSDQISNKNLYLFVLANYFILFLSNELNSINFSSNLGFSDQLEYLKIIISAPNLPEKVHYNQAQRFFFPYVIGYILEIINYKTNFQNLFIFLNIFINLLILQVTLLIFSHIKVKKNIQLVFISALIFNAYNFRISLFAPLMLNDYLFAYGLLLIVLFFLKKEKISFFYSGIIICSLTRQTSLTLNLLFLGIILYKVLKNKNYKINIFINGIIINLLIFFILKFVANEFSSSNFANLSKSILGLFSFNYNFLELIVFIIHMLNANLFLFILFFLLILNFNTLKIPVKLDFIIILSLGVLVWAQPILGGPSFTSSNISRLTVISLPVFLVFFQLFLKI